jgi:hypothetical protein
MSKYPGYRRRIYRSFALALAAKARFMARGYIVQIQIWSPRKVALYTW